MNKTKTEGNSGEFPEKSKESFTQYFEDNIRVHCKNNIMLTRKELIRLWFGWWYASLSIYSWYKGLEWFASANGLVFCKDNNHLQNMDSWFQK